MTASAEVRPAPVVFGVVLRDLEQYRALVHRIAASSAVAMTDFTFSGPVYKGNAAIKEGLQTASSAIEKFDVYATHALLDEMERVRFGRLFATQYLRRFPSSERSDVFLASGDLLVFSFELVPPSALSDGDEARAHVATTPHDAEVFEALCQGRSVESAHLRGTLKVFFDHVFNPRRHDLAVVKEARAQLGVDRPVVLELFTTGAVPFYLSWALQPLVEEVGGRLVLLPG